MAARSKNPRALELPGASMELAEIQQGRRLLRMHFVVTPVIGNGGLAVAQQFVQLGDLLHHPALTGIEFEHALVGGEGAFHVTAGVEIGGGQLGEGHGIARRELRPGFVGGNLTVAIAAEQVIQAPGQEAFAVDELVVVTQRLLRGPRSLLHAAAVEEHAAEGDVRHGEARVLRHRLAPPRPGGVVVAVDHEGRGAAHMGLIGGKGIRQPTRHGQVRRALGGGRQVDTQEQRAGDLVDGREQVGAARPGAAPDLVDDPRGVGLVQRDYDVEGRRRCACRGAGAPVRPGRRRGACPCVRRLPRCPPGRGRCGGCGVPGVRGQDQAAAQKILHAPVLGDGALEGDGHVEAVVVAGPAQGEQTVGSQAVERRPDLHEGMLREVGVEGERDPVLQPVPARIARGVVEKEQADAAAQFLAHHGTGDGLAAGVGYRDHLHGVAAVGAGEDEAADEHRAHERVHRHGYLFYQVDALAAGCSVAVGDEGDRGGEGEQPDEREIDDTIRQGVALDQPVREFHGHPAGAEVQTEAAQQRPGDDLLRHGRHRWGCSALTIIGCATQAASSSNRRRRRRARCGPVASSSCLKKT